MKALGVRVARQDAEVMFLRLAAAGLLRRDLVPRRDTDTVIFPVTEAPSGEPVGEFDFLASGERLRFRDLVDLPPDLKPSLPTSFDVIGDVAVIKLPAGLQDHTAAIGRALMWSDRRLRAVAWDRRVGGEFRVRDLTVISGDPDLRTVHREYGVQLSVDPSRAYFSPRLATERWRVTQLVRDGEVVVDLFTGVGPFSLLIARHRRPKVVYAIDANPEAIAFLEENVRKNRVASVVPLLGDARAILPTLEKADRVLVDLPMSSWSFFRDALDATKPGGTIHFYEVLDAVERREREEALAEAARAAGRRLEILRVGEVHAYSPAKKMWAFDLRAA